MHAVGIGELLWDLLPDGPRLGGAPCNVLINLVRLGHRATYVTGVGRDDLGRAALRQLIAHGVETSLGSRSGRSSPCVKGSGNVKL